MVMDLLCLPGKGILNLVKDTYKYYNRIQQDGLDVALQS